MTAPFEPGDIVAQKYRIEHTLGKGGMGLVVAARHVHLGELFAIKIMLPTALENQEAVERFLREARASVRLKGEHVARVQDVGNLENGAPYMVMEHLEGHDLKQVLKKRGPLPIEDVALYVYQACEAVAEAHGLGIVHRDLKPGNLFLTTRANGTPCVKVLDFGLAKDLVASKDLGSDLTTSGTFMGSPKYMSPEQMRQAKGVDARSDIWSLGVIMYELSTGRTPFNAETIAALISEVLTGEPDRPIEIRPTVPSAFDALVMRCLEKSPEARYQTVRELMADLRPFLAVDMPSAGVSPAVANAPATTLVQTAANGKTVVLGDGSGGAPTMPAPIEPKEEASPRAAAKSSDSASPWGNTANNTSVHGSNKHVKAIVAVLVLMTIGMAVYWIGSNRNADQAPISIPAPVPVAEQPTAKPEANAALAPAPTITAMPAASSSAAALPSTTTSAIRAATSAGGPLPAGGKTAPAGTTTKTKSSDSNLTLY